MSRKLVFGIVLGLSLLIPITLIIHFFRNMPEPLGTFYDSPLMVVGAGFFIWLMALGIMMVIYTHWNEKIRKSSGKRVLQDLPQYEHNSRANIILSQISGRLTEVKDEDDEEYSFFTIAKGRDARFINRGLKYINSRLRPDDLEINNRFINMKDFYNQKLQREFNGSWLIIIAALVVAGMLEAYVDYPYLPHMYMAGIVMYYFVSKVPLFLIEKRRYKLGGGSILSRIAVFLFSDIGGGLERAVAGRSGLMSDYQREKENSAAFGDFISLIFNILLLLFISCFISFFAIWKFFFNFLSRNLVSLNDLDKWYEKNFTN